MPVYEYSMFTIVYLHMRVADNKASAKTSTAAVNIYMYSVYRALVTHTIGRFPRINSSKVFLHILEV